ncbi:MAG: DUF58 domain-containing protein [Parabacteroides sp.]
METKDGIYQLLSPTELAQLDNLALGSRFAAEGTLSGAHRSPQKGFSVEFADHKSYTRGDDLKHLDWKAFGRNERLYIRQYEEETSLRLSLFIDASNSMNYAGADITKYQFACKCAAALAYIIIKKQDNAGLALFSDHVLSYLPPRGGPEHLRVLCNTLANTKPHGIADYSSLIHQLTEKSRKRGLVILFSDCFTSPDLLRSNLAHFRRKRHDVILYHVMDPNELYFPFRDVCAFQDLESNQKILTSAKEIKTAYLKNINRFLEQIKALCSENDVEYILASTDQEIIPLILRHLHQRNHATK